MKKIKIPYSKKSPAIEETYHYSVKIEPKVVEGVEGIFETFMNFTNGDELKSKVLTAIVLKETGGKYFRKNPSSKSTALGLMQCTKQAVKDVLSNSFSKKILEDLIPAILGVKKERVSFEVEAIYTLMGKEETKAVGLAVGFAYFELNMKRYGAYPIVGIASHYLPEFGRVIGKNIEYLKESLSIPDLINRLNVLEHTDLDKNYLAKTLANNNNQYPSRYVNDVIDYFVSLLKDDFKKALSYLISNCQLYSSSSWASSVKKTSNEHNLADYKKKNPESFVSDIKTLIDKNKKKRYSREQLNIALDGKKLDQIKDEPATPNDNSVMNLITSFYNKANIFIRRVFSSKKEMFSHKPGENKMADELDSITKFLLP